MPTGDRPFHVLRGPERQFGRHAERRDPRQPGVRQAGHAPPRGRDGDPLGSAAGRQRPLRGLLSGPPVQHDAVAPHAGRGGAHVAVHHAKAQAPRGFDHRLLGQGPATGSTEKQTPAHSASTTG